MICYGLEWTSKPYNEQTAACLYKLSVAHHIAVNISSMPAPPRDMPLESCFYENIIVYFPYADESLLHQLESKLRPNPLISHAFLTASSANLTKITRDKIGAIAYPGAVKLWSTRVYLGFVMREIVVQIAVMYQPYVGDITGTLRTEKAREDQILDLMALQSEAYLTEMRRRLWN